MFKSKRELVYIILAGLFITNAIVAELIGSKIIQIGPFVMSIGIIPWPIVFLTTDIINEHFGKAGVRKLSMITASLIAYAFIILFLAIKIPAAIGISTVTDAQFYAVFGQSLWIIVASLIAFILSQLIDVSIFWMLRDKTGSKMIWLRSTGSTVISQLIDTFVVLGIAFWLPGKMTTAVFLNAALTGYTFKLLIAVVLTPLIYVGHNLIEKYLGDEESREIIKEAAEESLHHKVEE
ncbi:MAG: putative queuosine precursor transporter [Bacteroidetes bacterium]|nr:putative queuosine precursor transporter [Bacteroidota bacterium]